MSECAPARTPECAKARQTGGEGRRKGFLAEVAAQSYGGDWGGDVKGKNKFKDGKGKGKKGKGKGKGKGGWNNWSPESREKGGEKAKKGEGET